MLLDIFIILYIKNNNINIWKFKVASYHISSFINIISGNSISHIKYISTVPLVDEGSICVIFPHIRLHFQAVVAVVVREKMNKLTKWGWLFNSFFTNILSSHSCWLHSCKHCLFSFYLSMLTIELFTGRGVPLLIQEFFSSASRYISHTAE